MAGICIDEDELENEVYRFVRDKMVQAEVDKAIKPLAQQVKDALSEAIAAKIRA